MSEWIAAIAACALVMLAIGGAYTKLKVDNKGLQKDVRHLQDQVDSLDREQAWQVRSLYRIMFHLGVEAPNGKGDKHDVRTRMG